MNADESMNEEPQRQRRPRLRALLVLTTLLVLGSLGYWLTTGHPIPSGPIAEQLKDRTWQFGTSTFAEELRLNADGTLRYGGVQDGTWMVQDDRIDFRFAPMPELNWKARIESALRGDIKLSYRILELTAESVTMQALMPDGTDHPTDKDISLTLTPP